MQIRSKLTLTFTIVVASILLIFSISIYYFSAQYRENEFYLRLSDKANTTARLLLEVQEVSPELLHIIDRNNLTSLPREQITIYNYLNQVVYDSDVNPHNSDLTIDLLNKIRLEQTVRFKRGDKEAVGLTFNHGYYRFVVIASAYDMYGRSKLKNLKIVLSAGFVASLLVVAIAGWFYAGRAVGPIRNIVEQVRNITVSNFSARVDNGNGKDELAQLATAFNQMLDRLQEAFEMQRSFVSNASHELRTPLTVITGQIEVAQLKDRSPEEYRHILSSILDDIKNLNKLSNDLLDLAQVSQSIHYINMKEVQIDDLVFQAGSTVLAKRPDYNIQFEFEENEALATPEFIVKGDASLLKTSFINLLENGCKFSTPHQVRVYLGITDTAIRVRIADQGMGIPEADFKNIFQPFFRSEHSKAIRGHGIGLSLTHKIVEMHGGEIQVHSQLAQGTTFTVLLPFS